MNVETAAAYSEVSLSVGPFDLSNPKMKILHAKLDLYEPVA